MIQQQSIEVFLNKNRYEAPIIFNQYDKNIPFIFELYNPDGSPYNFLTTDVIKVEININNIIAIISTGFQIEDNKVTCYLSREVTLNAGKGLLNVAIENATDNSRVASFSREIVVEKNCVSEDDVSTQLTISAKEELDNKITEATALINQNSELLSDGAAATKTELNTVDNKANDNTSSIGTLTNLETTEKSNLVEAVNEVKNNLDTANTNIQANKKNIETNTQDINTLKTKTNTSTSSVTLAYNVSVISGWQNIIRKINGYVYLDFGLVTSNTANDWTDGQLLFTLPEGYRPKYRQMIPVFTTRNGSGYVSCVYYLDIYVDGEAHIQLCNGDKTAIYSAYIQNICFLAAS